MPHAAAEEISIDYCTTGGPASAFAPQHGEQRMWAIIGVGTAGADGAVALRPNPLQIWS